MSEQLARLEKFVREGGGVAFFMGPNVAQQVGNNNNIDYYNKFLYANGKGLFPVACEGTVPPMAATGEELPRNSKQFQLLLREDQFPSGEPVPIFGEFLKQDRNQINWLKHLPVKRYLPAQPRSTWKGDPGTVKEIFTRPNNEPIKKFIEDAKKLAQALPKGEERYKPYQPGLKRHYDRILEMIDPTNFTKVGEEKVYSVDQPAYLLADLFDELLNDRGQIKDLKNFPNLTEFWNLPDPNIVDLRAACRRCGRSCVTVIR